MTNNTPNLAMIAHYITHLPKHFEDSMTVMIEDIIFESPSYRAPADEESDEWSTWYDREQIAGSVALISKYWNREDDPKFIESLRALLMTPRKD